MILCSFIWEVLIGVDVVYGLKCFCGLDLISLEHGYVLERKFLLWVLKEIYFSVNLSQIGVDATTNNFVANYQHYFHSGFILLLLFVMVSNTLKCLHFLSFGFRIKYS